MNTKEILPYKIEKMDKYYYILCSELPQSLSENDFYRILFSNGAYKIDLMGNKIVFDKKCDAEKALKQIMLQQVPSQDEFFIIKNLDVVLNKIFYQITHKRDNAMYILYLGTFNLFRHISRKEFLNILDEECDDKYFKYFTKEDAEKAVEKLNSLRLADTLLGGSKNGGITESY